LDYQPEYAERSDERWLPCADCEGTGRRVLTEVQDAEFKKGCGDFIAKILEALAIFSP
jgi:hypothetical protein